MKMILIPLIIVIIQKILVNKKKIYILNKTMYLKKTVIRKIFAIAGYKARKFGGFKPTNRVIVHAVSPN